jgi:hypothetical protein
MLLRVDAHDLLVQLFVVGVPADRLLDHVEGVLRVAGLLVELGEPAGGGDCLAAEVLAFGQGPVVVSALAPVGDQCLLKGGGLGGRSVAAAAVVWACLKRHRSQPTRSGFAW